MKKKKNLANKGFTLIEMVIAVAIVSMLFGSIVVIFPQWLSQYVMLRDTAEATEVMDVVAAGIKDELQFSKDRLWNDEGIYYVRGNRSVQIPLNPSDCNITYDNQVMTIEGRPEIFGSIFDESFYSGNIIKLTLQNNGEESKYMNANIEIYSEQGELLASEIKTVVFYNR